MLGVVVEAALENDDSSNGAVVIVTPTRNLRDAILRSPDFLGHVFAREDLGPRVARLGRPSNLRYKMCTWEDKVSKLVHERLYTLREQAEELEKNCLLLAI